MSRLSAEQIARLVVRHTSDRALAAQAVAVALAESGGLTTARNENRDRNGRVTSTDRGLWQINDRWHPEVSDAAADNPTTATAHAARIAGGGFRNMTPWSAYKNGSYKRHLQAAEAAVAGVLGGGQPGGRAGLTDPGGAPGPIGDVIERGADLVTAPLDGLDAVGAFFARLGERATWVRVAEVVGGVVLIIIGSSLLKVELVTDAAGKLLGDGKAGAAAALVPGGKAVKTTVAAAAGAGGK